MSKKLKHDPIKKSDCEEYLNNNSDFSFELQTLKKFVDLGLKCSHGGTYEDPLTNKTRQFDIRALLQNNFFRVHLSIECKNLRDYFPLIVHCLKRRKNESYNELIHTFVPRNPTQRTGPITLPLPSVFMENCRIMRDYEHGLYHEEEFVAKAVDQIGLDMNGDITSYDREVFDKITQAINSSVDLISEAPFLNTDNFPFYYTFVCPVLIVPDDSVWQVNYSGEGEQLGEPQKVRHVPYFIGKEWLIDGGLQSVTYSISHLEIITFSEINYFVNEYLGEYIDRF
ncbi:hypothetical protein KQH50_02520 [bacterium]|nr:hypothetical protein [bacterium]